ncbi:TrkA C-terminal domain-containing protein [Aquifex pyrophilus]
MSIVILGLGRYVEEITEIVASFSEVIVVEKEGEKLRNFIEKEKNIDNLSVIPGSATDLKLWSEKIKLDSVEAVISFLDKETTLTVAKVLRKAFGFKEIIVFVAKKRPENREFKELSIEIVSVPDILGAVLKNILKSKGLVRYPVGIGLGKGEISEVLITSGSPAAYLRLSELRMRNVRIALIYRGENIILPRTDLRIQPGDRLLVVGEPNRLELFLNMVIRGEPNFPLKWGPKGFICDVKGNEVEYVKEKLKVREWIEEDCFKGLPQEDIGIVLLDGRKKGFFGNPNVDFAFGNLKVPSLLLRGSFPYENILVSANTEALSFLLANVLDFARLFKSKLFILFVTSIEKMLTKEEKEVLDSLKVFVERTASATGLDIKLIRKEGNPVRETLKLMEGKFNLLAVGYTPGRKSRFWSPYVPYLLAKKSNLTTLLIPEVTFER